MNGNEEWPVRARSVSEGSCLEPSLTLRARTGNGMSDRPTMDAHTLELLEFTKVRELLAGYAACSLGKELARQAEPGTDAEKIRHEIALVSEMVDALDLGQSPPFGGLHDIRLT